MAIIYPVPYYILGNSADKIVSMRLYDKKYDENNPNWWIRKRDMMDKKSEANYKALVESNEYNHGGKVVNY